MPDVAVNFRDRQRRPASAKRAVASLNPQSYNATTLPPDFNLRARPSDVRGGQRRRSRRSRRGEYRLKIAVNDRIANTVANAETDFSVIGTPASLLAEAPPLGRPFRREAVLEPGVLGPLVDALTPASPSPALSRALAIARTGKSADLLVEEPVPPAEAGIRTALDRPGAASRSATRLRRCSSSARCS